LPADAVGSNRDEARRRGIRYIVFRLKRVRNPDVVALERLDVFLQEAKAEGLTVLLTGVRPDLHAAFARIGIADRHPSDLIFQEEDEDYSATLKAIRHAYALRSAATVDTGGATPAKADPAYYLV